MADILTKLSSKYKCDKSDKNHKYTPLYHKIFNEMRHSKFNMLEYGFGVGNSTKMWLEYFTKIKLAVVDVRKLSSDPLVLNHIKNGRLEYINESQISRKQLTKIFDMYKSFDIIIDDASHKAEDQQYTLGFSFPYVSKGGWYIIEDLKCRRNPSEFFDIQADKTWKVLKKYQTTKKIDSRLIALSELNYLNKNIEYIELYEKIAFIKKR